MAVIAVEGMKFYAYHGFYAFERERGGEFVVDVYVKTAIDWEKIVDTDDLNGTINYEMMFEISQKVMAVSTKLLETLAGRILLQIKTQAPDIQGIRIRVSKLKPPFDADVERTFVEIEENF